MTKCLSSRVLLTIFILLINSKDTLVLASCFLSLSGLCIIVSNKFLTTDVPAAQEASPWHPQVQLTQAGSGIPQLWHQPTTGGPTPSQ